MKRSGACPCQSWSVFIWTDQAPEALHPRRCDCDHCQAHPSEVLSGPDMRAEIHTDTGDLTIHTNGDGLASFYHCATCEALLAVGRVFDGQLRGAVNALLLEHREALGEALPIQPRLLSAEEKLARWAGLWGTLSVTGLITER